MTNLQTPDDPSKAMACELSELRHSLDELLLSLEDCQVVLLNLNEILGERLSSVCIDNIRRHGPRGLPSS